jgi:hypothetical protein
MIEYGSSVGYVVFVTHEACPVAAVTAAPRRRTAIMLEVEFLIGGYDYIQLEDG